jgi:hypothetical protein
MAFQNAWKMALPCRFAVLWAGTATSRMAWGKKVVGKAASRAL